MTSFKLFDRLSFSWRNLIGALVGSCGGGLGAFLLLFFTGPHGFWIVFPFSCLSGGLLAWAFWYLA